MEQEIIPTIDYRKGKVLILDQTMLPGEERVLALASPEQDPRHLQLKLNRGDLCFK